METPQLAFGFEDPEEPISKKVPSSSWGLTCKICDGVEEYMAQAHHKADWIYQASAQNLATSRMRLLRTKNRRSHKKALARMMRLHQVVIALRRQARGLEDMMYEARDRKTVCLSEYGHKCESLKYVL